MKQSQGFNGIILGGAAVLMAVQPVLAAPVQVTAVKLSPTSTGVDVFLQTKSGDRPQVFAVNRANSWTADITSTQLQVPGGNFRQENPAPGISLVTVAPLDGNSVRVTVVGQKGAPTGQVVRPTGGGVLFSVGGSSSQAAAPAASARPLAPPIQRSTAQSTAQRASTPAPSQSIVVPPAPQSPIAQAQPATPAQPVTPAQPAAPTPVQPVAPDPAQPAPLVPNPEITIQGAGPASPTVPPLQPRAVAPPVGDIAAAQVDASATTIDLGTAERVPRLVLRDAPAREVLSLLARAAGLNLAFVADVAQPGQQGQAQQPGQATGDEGPKVTLDIENEPVQNVFNYVLQLTGLDANRVGRTVFVGPRLPNSARNLTVRSVRLNQVLVGNALNFLVALGAESAVSRERLVTSVNAVPVAQLAGATGGSAITQSQTTTEQRIETQRVNYVDSTPLLRGVQVSGDERTNTLTLVGDPKKVNIAIAQLVQLDVRRRQVTVNVRVIDVDLARVDRFSANASFGIDNTRYVQDAGVAILNFGRTTPGGTGTPFAPTSIGSAIGFPGTSPFTFARNFLLQLQAAITNGNAKILTDPTLLVQEGQTATINVTQEVVTNLTQQTTATGLTSTTTVTVQKGRAGLILPIQVNRIDDNGFVSLSVAPSVSRIGGTQGVTIDGNINQINLLSERRLESGQVRLRDGQTLLLSGIIQDEDRATITKVPILGDIPLLGALFRRTERTNQRREVIVIVTPRVVDDTDRSTFGYGYTPGQAVQQILNQNDRKTP